VRMKLHWGRGLNKSNEESNNWKRTHYSPLEGGWITASFSTYMSVVLRPIAAAATTTSKGD
jgi:hypothetical protein